MLIWTGQEVVAARAEPRHGEPRTPTFTAFRVTVCQAPPGANYRRSWYSFAPERSGRGWLYQNDPVKVAVKTGYRFGKSGSGEWRVYPFDEQDGVYGLLLQTALDQGIARVVEELPG